LILARIDIVLVLDYILSENTLYSPTVGKRGSKSYAYLRLSDHGRVYKESIESQIKSNLKEEDIETLMKIYKDNNTRVISEYKFYLQKSQVFAQHGGFKRGDITNMVKAIEDSIFNVLSCGCKTFDDKNVSRSTIEKVTVVHENLELYKPRVSIKLLVEKSTPEDIEVSSYPLESSVEVIFGGDSVS